VGIPARGADQSAPVAAPMLLRRKRGSQHRPAPRVRRKLLTRGAPRVEPDVGLILLNPSASRVRKRPKSPADIYSQASSTEVSTMSTLCQQATRAVELADPLATHDDGDLRG
jgi:hypothetical protein